MQASASSLGRRLGILHVVSGGEEYCREARGSPVFSVRTMGAKLLSGQLQHKPMQGPQRSGTACKQHVNTQLPNVCPKYLLLQRCRKNNQVCCHFSQHVADMTLLK